MPARPGSDDQSQPTSANDMAGWSVCHQILVIFKMEEKWGNEPPQASHACGQAVHRLLLDMGHGSLSIGVSS